MRSLRDLDQVREQHMPDINALTIATDLQLQMRAHIEVCSDCCDHLTAFAQASDGLRGGNHDR
jgi:hypothetical protein